MLRHPLALFPAFFRRGDGDQHRTAPGQDEIPVRAALIRPIARWGVCAA
ncbi:hypothetical protein OG949_41260 (plasmid) [Streptomyces scopuliridis]|nr:hypothetical protein [Streptomyces scopuliridis]WSB39172.1 hypothetical protein OG949_41260 [Streptomyces scopuliridis]